MNRSSGWKQFTTVLRFEFTNYMHNKVYVGATIAFVLIIALLLSLPAILGFIRDLRGSDTDVADDPTATVYIVHEEDTAPDPAFYEQTIGDLRWELAPADSLETLRTRVHEGDARAVFVVHAPFDYTHIIRREGLGSTDALRLQNLHDGYYREAALTASGLSPTEIESLLTPSAIQLVETVGDDGKTMEQAYLYTYLLVMMLYMTVMLYGQMVATSVASEKGNRAMEMLITSARPVSLMFGKVIGTCLAGLSQIGALLLSALVFYRINEAQFSDIPMVQSAFEAPPSILIYAVVFYLVGFFMYAFLYGALGSLASRTEDINTSIMPVILIMVAALMVSVMGMTNPDASFVTVCSFIPLLAPMTLFVRIAMTDVPGWQIALSLFLMLGTTIGIGWISARIYRIGVLMYGKPPRLPELIRILQSERRVRSGK